MKEKMVKKLIVGLGNPGKEYENTRHNFGFEALDFFVSQKNKQEGFDFPIEFFEESKFQSLFGVFNVGDKKIFLAKPMTFMNLSGRAVRKIVDFYKIEKNDLLIVHDEFDLDLGIIRFSKSASSAGHRGVESVIKELGGNSFCRLRLGVKNAGFLEKTKMSTEKFVLEKFLAEEEDRRKNILENAGKAIEFFIEKGDEKMPQKFYRFEK